MFAAEMPPPLNRAKVRRRRPFPGRSSAAKHLLTAAIAALVAGACTTPQRPPEKPRLPVAAPAPPPIDVQAELSEARSAREGGRSSDAELHLERAAAADANSVEARLDLAELLLKEGSKVTRAVTLLDEAERLQSATPRQEQLRGWAAEIQGDDAGAAAAYGRVLAVAPDPDLRLRRGQILARLGRRGEAAAELAAVVADRPTDRAAHTGLAEIYEGQGRLREAESELLQLASLAVNDPGPQRRLAAFYLRHGDKRSAQVAEARARSLEGAPRALRPLRASKR